ncbi:MAG TPA: hypothetical protein VGK89_04045 [Candidatus Eisenbacteria bacterium]
MAGFYWAVVETVGAAGDELMPPLPGPKPRDYRYTAKRDSVFIFNVFEGSNNRQHAFYIYAVDNQGKADPTPARVIFNSLDRFPPIPIILQDSTYATGFVFHQDNVGDGLNPVPAPIETTVALRDTFSRGTTPRDVVPVGSLVNIEWTSAIAIADNPAVAYKYKIGEGEEVDFVEVPASITGTQYNTTDRNRIGAGVKIFTLRAIDQAGGARTSPETTRRFYMNLAPDTWFAGPDSVPATNTSFYTVGTKPFSGTRERYKQLTAWPTATSGTEFPGSLLSPDSVQVMPAWRGRDPSRGPSRPNKTFFELFTETVPSTGQRLHRIYVHGEGDTVHLNSYVLFHAGGFDADSPYRLRTLIPYPPLPIGTTPVLRTSDRANGSPIGFHFRIPVFLDSIGPVSTYPESHLFPLTDPNQIAEPHIGAYQAMQLSGRAYCVMRSEDGSGDKDNRILDPVTFVDSLEKNLIKPGMPRYQLRDKVITFYVNRAPYLLRGPTFQPRDGQQIFQRALPLRLDLVADDDPFDPYGAERTAGGTPNGQTPPTMIRYSVLLRGKLRGSDPPRDTLYTPLELRRIAASTWVQWSNRTLTVPDYIEGPDVAVEIEVCDCKDCEDRPGQGRCRRYPPIHVTLVGGTPSSAVGAQVSSEAPGSSREASRSRTP